jgi:hypothetical protein
MSGYGKFIERGTESMNIPTALKKLQKGGWKCWKREVREDGTVEVVENGVHLTGIKHKDWAEILKAMHEYGGD